MNLEEEIINCKRVHAPARNSLVKLLRDKDFKVGVEIGVQYGLNAERWLKNAVVQKLYGVDPYDSVLFPIAPLKVPDDEIYQDMLKRMKVFKNRYIHIRKTSNEALLDIDGTVDCIYIDGETTDKATYDDISFWYPKLRKGGIMAGHNYNHPSFPHIKKIVDNYFGVVPYTSDGYVWWYKRESVINDKKVSVVTPFYNAARYMAQLMASVDDPRINEVIIVDDFSTDEEYIRMRNIVSPRDEVREKVKVFRNPENFGEFKTRIRGAEEAQNDWVIFLDNDNFLLPEYLDAIYSIPQWRDDVIYAPDYGNHVHINYRELDGNYINKKNTVRFMKNSYMFTMFLNTGNYLMNRNKYLDIAKPISEIAKHSYGDIYFNGAWLESGNSIFVVPGMEYKHTIRKDSAWKEHIDEMQPVINEIMSKLG